MIIEGHANHADDLGSDPTPDKLTQFFLWKEGSNAWIPKFLILFGVLMRFLRVVPGISTRVSPRISVGVFPGVSEIVPPEISSRGFGEMLPELLNSF